MTIIGAKAAFIERQSCFLDKLMYEIDAVPVHEATGANWILMASVLPRLGVEHLAGRLANRSHVEHKPSLRAEELSYRTEIKINIVGV